MSAFTDRDLKKIKKDLARSPSSYTHWFSMEALLARLEAAELCAEYGKLLAAYLSNKNLYPWEQGAIEVWSRLEKLLRKAAGK